jgi:hypothetical protein
VPIAAYHPSTGHLKIMEKGKEGLVVSQIWNPTTDIVQYKSLQLSLPEEGNSKRVHSEVSAENTNTEDLEEEFRTILEDQILVHGDSGPYLMNKDRWPNMPLSGKNNRTLNEDLSQGFCLQEMQGGEVEEQAMLSVLSSGEARTQSHAVMESKMDWLVYRWSC